MSELLDNKLSLDFSTARDRLKKVGLSFHFIGEGVLIGGLFHGGILSLLADNELNLQRIASGVIVYTAYQIPAYVCLGLGLTGEENKQRAEQLKHEALEESNYGLVGFSVLSRGLSRIHQHIADHGQRYDRILEKLS